MTAVNDALNDVRRRIADACRRSGRAPATVRLIAVSKTFPLARILDAAAAGQEDFGESYVQEALPKIASLAGQAGPAPHWHFIGPIQGNKAASIAAAFSWVHGVDRERTARRLSERRPEGTPPLQVCVQVNVSAEAAKSGCSPAEAPALCAAIAALPRLQLRGLMCIPEASDDPEATRPAFAGLRTLLGAIRAGGAVPPRDFDTLSMGMSSDLEVAIEEGATMVRVGSAIFGAR